MKSQLVTETLQLSSQHTYQLQKVFNINPLQRESHSWPDRSETPLCSAVYASSAPAGCTSASDPHSPCSGWTQRTPQGTPWLRSSLNTPEAHRLPLQMLQVSTKVQLQEQFYFCNATKEIHHTHFKTRVGIPDTHNQPLRTCYCFAAKPDLQYSIMHFIVKMELASTTETWVL